MRTILTLLILSSLSVTCKMLPHSIRSNMQGEEVYGLLEQDSIKFERNAARTGGNLSFQLKGRNSCRVEYWADDPNGKPPPGSPMTVNCPNDGASLTIKLAVDGITAGVPLTFRITIWPRALTALSGLPLDFHENQELFKIKASNIIVARYVAPRNSNEIYTYQFPDAINMSELKAKMTANYNQDEAPVCSDTATASNLPYPRFQSADDAQKRPLHGLSEVSTDGFGRAAAKAHPFFPTRLTQFYEYVEPGQNWKWNFKWEGSPFTFETFPPGYMVNLSLNDAGSSVVVKNRLLGNVLPVIDTGAKAFRLTPSNLYPTAISGYELVIKAADASKTLLRCQYSINQESLAIPDSYFQKLAAGEYLATLVFETNQIHYLDGAGYPPWLITAQDWIHFKINKKM